MTPATRTKAKHRFIIKDGEQLEELATETIAVFFDVVNQGGEIIIVFFIRPIIVAIFDPTDDLARCLFPSFGELGNHLQPFIFGHFLIAIKGWILFKDLIAFFVAKRFAGIEINSRRWFPFFFFRIEIGGELIHPYPIPAVHVPFFIDKEDLAHFLGKILYIVTFFEFDGDHAVI